AVEGHNRRMMPTAVCQHLSQICYTICYDFSLCLCYTRAVSSCGPCPRPCHPKEEFHYDKTCPPVPPPSGGPAGPAAGAGPCPRRPGCRLLSPVRRRCDLH